DLGALALAAVVARFVLARAQAAFDVDLAASLQVFLAGLRRAAVDHNVVPIRSLVAVTLLVGEDLVGGDRKVRHRLSAHGQQPQLWILSEIADKRNPVQRHRTLPPPAGSAIRGAEPPATHLPTSTLRSASMRGSATTRLPFQVACSAAVSPFAFIRA